MKNFLIGKCFVLQHVSAVVEALKDLTADLEIKVSSRQAMVGSLTDNSTETFWESGDEDRNKTKFITVLCPPNCIPKMIYIHIDNCRDLAVSYLIYVTSLHHNHSKLTRNFLLRIK